MKWSKSTLGEIVANDRGLVQTGPFGSSLHQSDYSEEGIPVIMPTNITDGRVSQAGIARIPENTANRLERHKLKPRTIVLPRRGEITKRAFIREDQEGWLCGSGCLKIETHDTEVMPEFLYYYMAQHDVCQWLEKHAVGSTMLNLSAGIVNDMPVHYPQRELQQYIANTLAAYDDLMENNRRRMVLLEESARLLYREWFVHLRFPGHEHTRITNGVPQGWERVELNSIINVTHGYAFQGADFSDEPTSLVLTTPGNFRIGGGIKLGKPKFYSEAGPLPPNYILAPMDLIVTMTDLSKDSDTLGYPAFVPKLPDLTFLHNQRVGKVVPRGDFFPKHFLYFVLCDEPYRHHVVGAATGGVIKHTSPTRILSYKADLPLDRKLIEDFEAFASPLFAQINILVESNEKLRTARDLLLQRLMSGGIAL